jgi:hypothetical protein
MHPATPITATIGLALAAMAVQVFWRFLSDSAAVRGELSSNWPLLAMAIVLMVLAGAVALLVASRLRRLLLSVRMMVSLLTVASVMLAAGTVFVSEAGQLPSGPVWAGNERRAAEVCSRLLGDDGGRRAGELVLQVFRLMGLTDLPGNWALHAVLLLAALGALGRLIWRRPMGAREFGFMAVHAGAVLMVGGMLAGRLFGTSHPGVELSMAEGAAPLAIPPGSAADDAVFAVALREIRTERAGRMLRLQAVSRGRLPELLSLDATKPGRVGWRSLDVEVLEYLAEAFPEEVTVDAGVEFDNPAVRLELADEHGAPEKVLLYAFGDRWWRDEARGVEMHYVRTQDEVEAGQAARRPGELPPEKLCLLGPSGEEIDRVELPAGRGKTGHVIALESLGLRLEVVRWLSGAQRGDDGKPVPAPPLAGLPAAIELRWRREAAGPDAAPAGTFWVMGGERPSEPMGEVPDRLRGLRFGYNPERWAPLSLAVVEGPAGEFQLGEFHDGYLARVRPLETGAYLDLPGGFRLKLVEFLAGAERRYRPGRGVPGARPVPAVRLAVARGAVRESCWLFLEGARHGRLLGHAFSLRDMGGSWPRETAVVEIFRNRASLGTHEVSIGSPLAVEGYRLHLSRVVKTGESAGRSLGLVYLSVRRRPGHWAVFIGMALAAAGAPLLLWSRFRSLPDPVA